MKNEDDTKVVGLTSSIPNDDLQQPLDLIALCVGDKSLLSFVMTKSNEMLKSDDFKQHYAVLFTLGTVVEGCASELRKHPETLTTILQTYLSSLLFSSLLVCHLLYFNRCHYS
jgi:hypothetical protein